MSSPLPAGACGRGPGRPFPGRVLSSPRWQFPPWRCSPAASSRSPRRSAAPRCGPTRWRRSPAAGCRSWWLSVWQPRRWSAPGGSTPSRRSPSSGCLSRRDARPGTAPVAAIDRRDIAWVPSARCADRRARKASETVMIALDYAALNTLPIATDPFPHLVVPHFVPPADLAQVVADLPDIANGGSYPPDSLRLGPAAQALMRAMEGPELRQAIAARFGLDLSDAPTMVTLRGRTR